MLEREGLFAGPQLEGFTQKVQHVPHGGRADVRAKVTGPVLLHPPGKRHPGIRIAHVHPDIRVSLVILEQDIVKRAVQLDQVAFQQQRFQVSTGQHDVEIVYMGDHRGDLGRVLRILEITPHPVFQVDRLADVNDIALLFHQVTAGAVRQILDFEGQRVVHSSPSSASSSPPRTVSAVRISRSSSSSSSIGVNSSMSSSPSTGSTRMT